MSTALAESVREALARRLAVIAPEFGVTPPAATGDGAHDAAGILAALLPVATDDERLWLVYVAVSTVYPDEQTMTRLQRSRDLDRPDAFAAMLLETALRDGEAHGTLTRDAVLIQDAVLVDVNFSAKHEHNTGIQRVVRRTLPHWAERRDMTPVVWEGGHGSYRELAPSESARVLRWGQPTEPTDDGQPPLVIPYRCRVILTEVPLDPYLDGLVGLARFSGSSLAAIGYDAIPITSRDTVSAEEANRFARYLTAVKYMAAVSGISEAAADEFRGFAEMVSAQGLPGPTIHASLLPADEAIEVPEAPDTGRPLVLCVGSKEPRKNHVAVLYAAERLWREGLDFELLLIGMYGWDTRRFRSWLARLERAGSRVSAPHGGSEELLRSSYARARFTVFPSLHEGYGLPVAESLKYGTPAITTRYGSTAEIAASGGCLLVDPHDDEDILAAMRLLLTDDEAIQRLRNEATSRPLSTWSDYADLAWTQLAERPWA